MFVQYTGTNVHALGMYNKTEMKLNQSPQEVKGLQPGWNEISKEIWDQNKTNPTIKKMIEKGKLVVLPDVVTVTAKGKKKKVAIGNFDVPLKLKWFEEKRAIEIVKQTFSRDILQRWDDEEQRVKVRKALARQLKPLLNEESDRDDDSEDTDEAADDFFD